MRINETLVGGTLIGGIGAIVALYAGSNYKIGHLSDIGPGATPLGLGVLLTIFGVVMIAQGLGEKRMSWTFPIRNVCFVLSAAAAFGVLIVPFGLLPAVAVGSIIAASADRENSLMVSVALGLMLGLLCTVLFIYILRLPIVALRWSF